MKKNTLLLVGVAAAAYFLLKSKGGTATGNDDTIGRGEAGTCAVVTKTLPAVRDYSSYSQIVPATIRDSRLTAANLAEPLVTSGGTSSPVVIAANFTASSLGQSYTGMSSGVQYTVSAPHAPSASHAAALKQYGR